MEIALKGKVAIVTGAAGGLGKAIASAMLAEGVQIVMADIDEALLGRTAEELNASGGDVLSVKTDVSCVADLDRLVSAAVDKFGGIDILVNNAGVCPRTAFDDIAEDEWDRVLAINLKSVFLLSRKVLPYMKRKRWGRIINMASAAGKIGGVQVGAHYSASKAGIICLTKTLAQVAAPFGINVNAICPGVIGTEMTTSIGREKIDRYCQMIPLGRIGRAEDVAHAAVFLASDAAGYITGETTDVNGGFLMD